MKYIFSMIALFTLSTSAFAKGPQPSPAKDILGDEILFQCKGPADRKETLKIVTKDIDGENETILRAYVDGKFDRDWVLEPAGITSSFGNIYSAGQVATIAIPDDFNVAFVRFNDADYDCN